MGAPLSVNANSKVKVNDSCNCCFPRRKKKKKKEAKVENLAVPVIQNTQNSQNTELSFKFEGSVVGSHRSSSDSSK